MRTFFITASDTSAGKTYTTQKVARHFLKEGYSVQLVKPVETGVPSVNAIGDMDTIANALDDKNLTTHTLYRFNDGLASVSAAKNAGVALEFSDIVSKITALPSCDFRIIEGVGGVAVPLCSSGRDQLDLINALEAEKVVAVVRNELGAINQSRLLNHYTKSVSCPIGFYLNEIERQEGIVKESNLEEIQGSGIKVLNERALYEFLQTVS